MTDDDPGETMTAVHLHSGIGALAHSFRDAGYRALATHETVPELLDIQIANDICSDESSYLGGELSEDEVIEAVLSRCDRRDVTAVTSSPHPLSDAATDMGPIFDLVERIRPRLFVIENTSDNLSSFVEDDEGVLVGLKRSIRDRLCEIYNVDIVDVSAQTHLIGDLAWSKTLIVGTRTDLPDVVPASFLPPPHPGGTQVVLTEDAAFTIPSHAVQLGMLSPDLIVDDDGDDRRLDIIRQAIQNAMPPAIADVIASPPPGPISQERAGLRPGPAFSLISELPQSAFDSDPSILALGRCQAMLENVFSRLGGAPATIDLIAADGADALDSLTIPSAVSVAVCTIDEISPDSYDLVVGDIDGAVGLEAAREIIASSSSAAVVADDRSIMRLMRMLDGDRRLRSAHIFAPNATRSQRSVTGLVLTPDRCGGGVSITDHCLPSDTYVG